MNTPKGRRGSFSGWVVLGAAFVILVLGYAVRNTFSVFYPTIVEEFGWGRGGTALMFSISVIIYGLAAPVAGSLVDRFGPRLILPAGACLMGGGVALCSLASSQWQFYLLFGALVGVGLSLTGWTPLTAVVSKWFVQKRGLAFGIMSAGFGGSLILASVAQFLISSLGWKNAYIVTGVFSIAVIVPLSIFVIRRSPWEEGPEPNGKLQSLAKSGGSEKPGIASSSNGNRSRTSWTLSQAMKTREFWLLFSVAFCLLGIMEQTIVAHQVYFFRDVGYPPMVAASIYSVFGVAFVGGNMCASLSDRLGQAKVFVPACLLAIGGISLLFVIRDTSEPFLPFLFAVGFGLGLGTMAPVFFATVADLFQGRHFGAIQGTIVLGFAFGGAIAPWLSGFLYDKTHSYFTTFLIVLACSIITGTLMWLVARKQGEASSGPGVP